MNMSGKGAQLLLTILISAVLAGCNNKIPGSVQETADTSGKETAAAQENDIDKSVAPVAVKASSTPQIEGLIVDDPNIQFEGALEVEISPQMIKARRFTSEVLKKYYPDPDFSTKNADTTSGIVMKFRTSSRKITAYFTALPLSVDKERGADFAVYQNNQLYKEYKFTNKVDVAALEIYAEVDGPVTYEITFPSWANFAFSGLKLDSGKSLEKIPEEKKLKYAAIGDSITHAANQSSATNKSYPYILARKSGWELYNFAVGGSRVAPEIGKMLSTKQFDIITILIGYNDWNSKNNTSIYKSDINLLIENIRKSQPNSKIFCITPTTSKAQMNDKKKFTLDDYRQALRDIVRERSVRGDKNIFVINGEEITTEKDLLDLVHLNYNGAMNFSEKLYEKITYILENLPK